MLVVLVLLDMLSLLASAYPLCGVCASTFRVRGSNSSAFLIVIQGVSTGTGTSSHLVDSCTCSNQALGSLTLLLCWCTDYSLTLIVGPLANGCWGLAIGVGLGTSQCTILEVPVIRVELLIWTRVILPVSPSSASNNSLVGGSCNTTSNNINDDSASLDVPLFNVLVVESANISSVDLVGSCTREEVSKVGRCVSSEEVLITSSHLTSSKVKVLNGSVIHDCFKVVVLQAADWCSCCHSY
mmetsp:Transcript_34913/g.48709  ORF Transcript_34913/g.48709 Transcript_34913/m.48709 type:complete len:240 (+) Transcript_34913:400-1119(+)